MNEKYRDKMNNNNTMLRNYDGCAICKEKLTSIMTISNLGGDPKLCYNYNKKNGLIK